MKRTLALLLVLILAVGLLAGCGKTEQPAASGNDTQSNEPAAKKTMIIGDTTFNAENWEETIDPHRTYNGWPCIRYGAGALAGHRVEKRRRLHLDHHPARGREVLLRPRHGRGGRQAVL